MGAGNTAPSSFSCMAEMSLIRTQPLEEHLGFRVLRFRVPKGIRRGGAIIQACNREGGHLTSVYFFLLLF